MAQLTQLNEGTWVDEVGLPVRIRIFQPGNNIAPDTSCENVTYDPADAVSVLAANNRADGKIVFDIGHSTVTGGDSRHVGIGDYFADETGVWANDIKWQPIAFEALKMGTLRYISPAFKPVKSDDGSEPKIGNCLSVALTNIPATKQSLPIVRSAMDDGVVHAVTDPEVEKRFVRKLPNGKWRVYDHTGKKNLGTFDTKAEATKHLKAVEYFKGHPSKRSTVNDVSRSSIDQNDVDRNNMAMNDEDKLNSTLIVKREDDGAPDDDDDFDMDDIDIDKEGMTSDELRETLAKCMDKLRDALSSNEKRSDDNAAKDDEEKRSTVNALWRSGKINFVEKAQLMKRSLIEVRSAAAKHGSVNRAPSPPAFRQERDPQEPTNKFARASSMKKQSNGFDDKQLAEALKELGVPADVIVRHGLAAEVPGKVWGTNYNSWSAERRSARSV